MEEKKKWDVWDYLLWISIILILGWAFSKSMGWINTDEWVLMIPYFAAGLALLSCAFKAGKISKSLESMGDDVKDLKTKTGDIDTSLIRLSERVALREYTIKQIDEKVERAILEILEEEKYAMSISFLTKEIHKRYKMKVSPQIVKRHLESLKEKGEIEEE